MENNIIENHLNERSQMWDDANKDMTLTSQAITLNDEIAICIPLGMFHYTLNDNEEILIFELEISKTSSLETVRVSFCENNSTTDCWEVKYISPKKLDIIALMQTSLSSVRSSNQTSSLILDYAQAIRSQLLMEKKINFLTHDLKLIRFYTKSLKPAATNLSHV